MKILVISDSHNNIAAIEAAISHNPDIDLLIHLGDGENDIITLNEKYPNLEITSVKGNCDRNIESPLVKNIIIEDKKIFITHGHLYGVKDDMYNIFMAAREHNADIALFGHTHIAFQDCNDGMYIMNPGCINNTYGIIDITPSGIVTSIVNNENY